MPTIDDLNGVRASSDFLDAQPTWKHIPLPIEGRVELYTWDALDPRRHHIVTNQYQYVLDIIGETVTVVSKAPMSSFA